MEKASRRAESETDKDEKEKARILRFSCRDYTDDGGVRQQGEGFIPTE